MGSLFRLIILIALGLGGYTLYNTYRGGEGFTAPVIKSEAEKTVSSATTFTKSAGSVLGAMVVKSGLIDVAKSTAETAQYNYCKSVIEKYESK